jgi:putative GTP pyrophosphokinase
MTTAAPYSKKRIKRAGDVLRDFKYTDNASRAKLAEAVVLVDEWRAAHARPLKSINANLRYYVRKQGVESQVTQRLKRFSTIMDKLRREPSMVLSRMEDIGGVRAILPSQAKVDAIVRDLESQPRWTIRRKREYIEGREGPKADGYRAVHLVVVKDGYFVEIQSAHRGRTRGRNQSSRTLAALVRDLSSVPDRTICESIT